MYQAEPSEKELSVFGFLPSDFGPTLIEMWPDTEPAIQLFWNFRTQWRAGMNGPYGLDYGPIFHKMDRMNLTVEQYDALEEDLRTMEQAALVAMNDQEK